MSIFKFLIKWVACHSVGTSAGPSRCLNFSNLVPLSNFFCDNLGGWETSYHSCCWLCLKLHLFVKTFRRWLSPLLRYQALTKHLSEFCCCLLSTGYWWSCILWVKQFSFCFLISHKLLNSLNGLIGSIKSPSIRVLSNSWFSQPSLAYWDC